jgi:hypothetical protein
MMCSRASQACGSAAKVLWWMSVYIAIIEGVSRCSRSRAEEPLMKSNCLRGEEKWTKNSAQTLLVESGVRTHRSC